MKSSFIVLRFMLQHAPDGRLTQTVSRCGEFSDVEQAFDLARLEDVGEALEVFGRLVLEARRAGLRERLQELTGADLPAAEALDRLPDARPRR